MKLEKLRTECPFGELSCRSDGEVVRVYVRTSSGSLIARINTKLTTDGSLEVMSIRPLISDQEGSQLLMALAEREKIPHNTTSTIINQTMSALPL